MQELIEKREQLKTQIAELNNQVAVLDEQLYVIDAQEEKEKLEAFGVFLGNKGYTKDADTDTYTLETDKYTVIVEADDYSLIIEDAEGEEILEEWFDTYEEIQDFLEVLNVTSYKATFTLQTEFTLVNGSKPEPKVTWIQDNVDSNSLVDALWDIEDYVVNLDITQL